MSPYSQTDSLHDERYSTQGVSRVHVHETIRDMTRCVADMLVSRCACAVAERGEFTLALSGGRTPLELFQLLRSEHWKKRIDWPRTRVFWADERCVPPDHPESNAGAALRELLAGVPVGEIHRMRGEDPPAEAAHAYAQVLWSLCENAACGMVPESRQAHAPSVQLVPSATPPQFDCILLGLGTDGHTASLFPGSALLDETTRLVADCLAPDGRNRRLTLTLPVLNAARCCLFMVSGTEKRSVLAACLDATAERCLPAQRVHPTAGELVWVVDRAACPDCADTGSY